MPLDSASLYRRHRPRTFADVIGQEHVVRTLSNALIKGRVHHAYLFVGSRGTGKTSMAKILAASLNCERGPTTEPCRTCDSCRAIASATSLDVIELDAASNNSVDDIRDLREKVAFAPVSGRHKVYILDEAHMLTTAAWNAFLKTLEEPPANTIFVLATTEANKVLPTVVDRCHRFDFVRPTQRQIADVLRRVAAAESIAIGDDSLALIGRAATGSFRDALGTLEQIVGYAGQKVAVEDVLAILGAVDADLLFGAIDAVAASDGAGALRTAARLAESGRDIGRFFGDLEAHLRGLMIVQTLGDVPDALRVTPEHDARLAEQAARIGPDAVVFLLDLVAEALRATKDGADAQTQLELTLVKAARPERDATVKALRVRLERLERAAAAPDVPPATPLEPVPAGTGRPRNGAATAGLGVNAVTAGAETATGSDGAEIPLAGDQPAIPAPKTRNPHSADSDSMDGPTPSSDDISDPAPRNDQAATEVLSADTAPALPDAPALSSDPVPAASAPSDPAPASAAIRQDGIDLPGVVELWPAVLEDAQERSPVVHAVLQNARPFALTDGELTLSFPEAATFYKRKAEDRACHELITTAIRSVTGNRLRLAYALSDDEPPIPTAPDLTEDELIDAFMREFDAEELPADEES